MLGDEVTSVQRTDNLLKLEEQHPEFDWITLKNMESSGAKGVATSFKVVSGTADFSPPFLSIYPRQDALTGKYLIANFSGADEQFQFFCLLDYQLLPCHGVEPESKPILLPSGTVQVVPVHLPTKRVKTQDFLILGMALTGELDPVSYRAILNPNKKANARSQQTKMLKPDLMSNYSRRSSDMGLSANADRLNGLSKGQNPAYFLIENADNSELMFVFSVCINQKQSAKFMESSFLNVKQKTRYAFKLKKRPEKRCDQQKFGTLTNPNRILEQEGKILQSLSVDFSDTYALPFYHSFTMLPD